MSIANDVQTWKFDTGARSTAGYQPGPWRDEPDKAQWVDAATDLDCLIVRNGSGALCGYVGLPETHPWHGKDYDECLNDDCDDEYCYSHSPGAAVDVHGGLTFASSCDESGSVEAICHVPLPGRTADVWWFGFDTAHGGDLCPGHLGFRGIGGDGTYRDVGYVQAECASLAQQLAAVNA